MNFESKFYWYSFLGGWLFYLALLPLVNNLRLYEIFPGVAIVGYGVMIASQLVAINFSERRRHYLLLGVSLIVMGAIASLDILLNRIELAELWAASGWLPVTAENVEGYIQILIIILNIFTGSLAAQCLFYGLNRRSFELNQEQ